MCGMSEGGMGHCGKNFFPSSAPLKEGYRNKCSLNTTKFILTNRSESQEILEISVIHFKLLNAMFSRRSSCCFLWLMSCLINKTIQLCFQILALDENVAFNLLIAGS